MLPPTLSAQQNLFRDQTYISCMHPFKATLESYSVQENLKTFVYWKRSTTVSTNQHKWLNRFVYDKKCYLVVLVFRNNLQMLLKQLFMSVFIYGTMIISCEFCLCIWSVFGGNKVLYRSACVLPVTVRLPPPRLYDVTGRNYTKYPHFMRMHLSNKIHLKTERNE